MESEKRQGSSQLREVRGVAKKISTPPTSSISGLGAKRKIEYRNSQDTKRYCMRWKDRKHWQELFKFNEGLYSATNIRHCPSNYLIQQLIDSNLCWVIEKTDQEALATTDSKELQLTERLCKILAVTTTSCTEKNLRALLSQGEFPACRRVLTFTVTVQLLGGSEVKVILDEDCRRVSHLKNGIERKVGALAREQELYWCEDERKAAEEKAARTETKTREDEEEFPTARVAEGTVFDKACKVMLLVNTQKPNRPRFMVSLFAELRRVLSTEKYAELKTMVTKVKASNRQDKATGLLLQIRVVIGQNTMKIAIAKAKAELKARKAQLKRYEALLLHIVKGGTADTATDTVACRNLTRLLEHYRANGSKENAHLDQQVNAMRAIIDNAEDPLVLGLRPR
jgi:hypothetical protein